jgi:hypothetical protein
MAENLNASQVDTRGQANSELWRYGIEDLDRMPFRGQGVWKSVGPAPLIVTGDQMGQGIGPDAGEVVDIALDPSGGDNVTIYIATNNGGVWKSTNGGGSWQPLTDLLASSAIGAVAIDPGDPRVVYAGTGNLFDGATGLPRATGLFKSVDGGITWAHMDGGLLASVFADHGINRIVCPAPGAVLVACDNGLFFSKNAGVTFGNNHPDYDNGLPVRHGFISALIPDTSAITQQPITDATGAGPIVITSAGHGFQTEDRVHIGGVTPTRAANGSWIIDRIDDDSFSLRGSLSPGIGATSGVVMGPAHPRTLNVQAADRVAPGNLIVIRSDAHGLLTGDYVAIHGVGGNTNANRSWQVHVRDADHFDLIGSSGNAAYTGGGIIDAPRHSAPQAITAAVNEGTNIRFTVPGHRFITGDQVTLTGLPGINAPNNVGFVVRIDADTFRIGGRSLNAPYAGGGTVAGPAAAWNSAFFVSAGPAGADRGLFRITLCSDGGLVLSDNLLTHPGGPAAGGGVFGRVVVAQSFVPRPQTLYLSVQNNLNYLGFFHSDNYGRTWTRRFALDGRLTADGTGQSAYDLTIGVDPQDSTRVYAALQRLWRSTNRGVNFDPVDPPTGFGDDAPGLNGGIDVTVHSPSSCMIHVDHHVMAFDPPTRWVARVPLTTTMYFGTDGGLSRSDDGGVTYQSLNEGLNTGLLRGIDIGRGDPANKFTYGGMQDLGNAGRGPDLAEFTWGFSSPGDGDFVAVDPGDPKIVYAFQNDVFAWTPNGGNSWFTENNPLLRARPIITEVRNTNPVQVVTAGHPFRTGDTVVIAGVPGGGGLANGASVITRIDNFIFTLNGKNGTTAPAFAPGPVITGGQCATSRGIAAVGGTAPIEIRTSTPHGFTTGDQVHIEGVLGRTVANNTDATAFWTITVISPTVFSLDGTDATVAPPHVPGTGRVVGPRRVVSVPIQLVTRATPIVVTAIHHGFVTGDAVTVANVLGTTAANNDAGNPNWTITVIDTNSVVLRGSVGNAPFILGPRAAGPSIGRNMGARPQLHRIAVVPDVAHPLIFVSRRERLLSSNDGGVHFNPVPGTPWSVANERVVAIAAPDANQLWIATLVFNNAGAFRPSRIYFRGQVNGAGPLTWFGAAQNFVRDPGALGIIWAIAVDPRNSQNVALVASGFSETHIRRRTRHCFVTTTGGRTVGAARAWTEVGGVFDAASGNLPDFPVLSVVWVPDSDPARPSTLLVASDAGVLRLGGDHWERVGPNLPNVSCQTLRIDTTVNPPVIRVGTYGRSAWELVRPAGPSLVVRAQLGFGERLVGSDTRLPLALCSVGDAPVHVDRMDTFGDFTFDPPTAPGFDIPAGESRNLHVRYHPSAAGPIGTILQIGSNDPANPLVQVRATGIGVAAGRGRLSVRRRVDFGIVANGAAVTVPLEIANTGQDTLNLTTLQLDAAGSAAITLPGAPVVDAAHPFPIAPGEVRTITIQFAPTAAGAANRVLHIGPTPPPPLIDVRISGTGVAAGSPNLLASVIHFIGLDDGDDNTTEAIA